jgi:protein-L-isoaspartate(D-aspartate) O-methyltransferase
MDYSLARSNMVDSQLRTNRVTDPRVVAAFGRVPRERFLPEALRGIAYLDEDLDLGGGRCLMEPMVLARLLQAARIETVDVVLDVGCATGYSSAVLASLAATIVAVESDPALAGIAEQGFAELSIDNVILVRGDLARGAPDQGPYDVILLNGAVAEVPQVIRDQLTEDGRLVTVQIEPSGQGRAVLMERHGGRLSTRTLFDANTPGLPGFQREPGFVF